jgi:TRAP transporter 4TM/12TM fusion protein
MSTYIVLFIIFAAFLEYTRIGEFFTDLAFALTRGMVGGPAKAAVISSAFMGSVSGSGVANVATTGTFTIPLMKKAGYQPHFAGAVEAAASNGGQFMPPVMAAAAFIMAEFTSIPYITIIKRAAFPAVLYFLAVLAMVHFEAKREKLSAAADLDVPGFGWLLIRQGYLMIPLIVLVYLLIIGNTPMKSCFYAIMLVIGLSFINPKNRLTPYRIFQALVKGAQNSVPIATTCACAGIVIGSFSQTGLGFKFSELIMYFSAGNILIALVITMISSIILGMGMPTSAAYILISSLGAPALIKLGIPMLSVHMFILYFGIMSGITPPVALVSYTAAGIAGADIMKTGFTSMRVALVAFIVPFMFAYNQAIFLVGRWEAILRVIFTGSIGAVMLAAALSGWLFTRASFIERLLMLTGSIGMIHPGITTDFGGLFCVMVAVGTHWFRVYKMNR